MPLYIYLPQDRLRALIHQNSLPDRANGAVLFADISGFTALTEALRDVFGPRRGAEELTRRIDAVYSNLIGEIEGYGGSVISFAGDSMLCWFDDSRIREQQLGNEHTSACALAVACGLSLQRIIQIQDKLTLPDQSMLTFALKVSVASGVARRFVVGDPDIQRIDIIAGATVTRTAVAEHLAQKGDLVIDENTASFLGDVLTIKEWRSDENSGERFAVVAGLAKPVEPPIGSSLDLKELPPEALRSWLHPLLLVREQTGPGSFLTEFRPCVTMFIRFPGIDFDSDEAESQLNVFVQEAQQTAARHEGILLDVTIGDKGSYIYINFGGLNTHEDDGRRAVNAALELRQTAQELDFLQPVQIGITKGMLLVGAYGGQTRKTFGALGDDVNLAARLMMTAEPGEILVSSHIHKAVEQYFVFEPRPPLPMKGKAEPLPVFAVTSERKQRAIRLQEPNYVLPMVGRQSELHIINDKLDLAAKGQTQVIGIVAEAGMGKSRLVAEIIRLAHKNGFVGYGGACQSDGVNTPYLAWKGIWSAFFDVDPGASLKKQMRFVENVLEDYAPNRLQAMPLLNVVLDMETPENDFTSNLEPQYRKSALIALFEDCLRSAAKDEPLLIVIEDVHWIDALSHDLLEDLAKMLADSPICFVLAYRPSQITHLQTPRWEALPQFTKIELHELSRAEAEQAIRAKLAQLYPARGGAVPTQLVDKLMSRSQGNPFYLEELLNFLRDRGLDPRESSALERIELPDSLHTLVLSRIDQLSEREKTTLRVASIVGRLFRAAWLTGYYPALGKLAHVKVDLDKLDRMDITPLDSEPELAYLFKHIVTHEVTYESLPFGLRAQLHEQLARYLERQIVNGAMTEAALLDTLVFHYTHSENKAKQREYLAKAGEAALNTSALITALEHFTKLLELTPEGDPSRSMNAQQVAESHLRLGDLSAAQSAVEQAQAAARTDVDRAAALTLLGRITDGLGDYVKTQTILAEAVPLARSSGDRLTLCRALDVLGVVNLHVGRLEEARLALEESLALSRELGDVPRELRALDRLGIVAHYQGDLAGAERLCTEVYTRAVAVGNREWEMNALEGLGAIADERADFTLAQEYVRRSLAIAREIGAQAIVAIGLMNQADGNIKLGNGATARMELREGLALAQRHGILPYMVLAVTIFGQLAYAEGKTEQALVLFGLARRQPALRADIKRAMDMTLAKWELDPDVVEAGLAKGAELDWDETIEELLKG